jgi:beta-glucosidase
MHIKKVLLTTLFLLYITIFTVTDQQTPTKEQSLFSYIKTSIGNFFSTEHKPLDWQSKYKKKESSQTSKTPITDATISAQKFKTAIENAADKDNIMARFKNNPEKFLFGASSSSYQYEGGLDEHNASAAFYRSKNLPTAGKAIDFWNKYPQDIKQMKHELGINSFRLSIAWDRVQPQQGVWDNDAITKYVHIITTLKKYGIEPIVVLHHYTIPIWFAEIGGFEKKANITHFVEFAKKMYTALHEHVTYWSTFNAIEGYAFKGYYTLDGPPGIKKNMQLTQQVMANMLEAHVQIYRSLKKMYPDLNNQKTLPNPLIGIQKNIVLLDSPDDSSIYVYTATQPIRISGTMLQNKGFFDFFTQNKFRIWIPSWVNITQSNNYAQESIDWIGLNIYSNIHMRFTQRLEEKEEDRKTENLNYRDYPEGIYRAVKIINDKIAKPLNIPIIITENGIATKNDLPGNEKRTRFFRRALYTIRKLIEQGCNIIGYTPWASHDNYEWPSVSQPNAFNRPYGMFAVDFSKPTLPRTLKTGAYYYRDFLKGYYANKL